MKYSLVFFCREVNKTTYSIIFRADDKPLISMSYGVSYPSIATTRANLPRNPMLWDVGKWIGEQGSPDFSSRLSIEKTNYA